MNFGLRYEYFSPPVQRGKATNFDLNGFVPARQIFHGFPDIPDTTDRPEALVYPDRNDFGPRFGFAYSTPWLQDFVLRGGYGMYYTPEITNSWTTLTLESTDRSNLCLYGQRNQSDQRRDCICRLPVRRASVYSVQARSIRICGPHIRSNGILRRRSDCRRMSTSMSVMSDPREQD